MGKQAANKRKQGKKNSNVIQKAALFSLKSIILVGYLHALDV